MGHFLQQLHLKLHFGQDFLFKTSELKAEMHLSEDATQTTQAHWIPTILRAMDAEGDLRI